MRVFVTGSDGYLGSLLTPELLKRGHDVIGLDTGFYKERMLYRANSTAPLTIVKDLRQVEVSDLKGVDAVVHMAELSNDPLGQLAPNITLKSIIRARCGWQSRLARLESSVSYICLPAVSMA